MKVRRPALDSDMCGWCKRLSQAQSSGHVLIQLLNFDFKGFPGTLITHSFMGSAYYLLGNGC